MAVAELAHARVEGGRELVVAAVALDGLHHQGRHRAVEALHHHVVDQLEAELGVLVRRQPRPGPVGIGMGRPREARHDGEERVVRVGPARRQRGERPPVIAVLEDDQVARVGAILEGELDRHLGREAAVQAISDLMQRAGRELSQLLGQCEQGKRIEVGPRVHDLVDLRDGGFDDPGIVGTEVVGPGLCRAVDVLAAFVVPDERSAGLHQRELFRSVRSGGLRFRQNAFRRLQHDPALTSDPPSRAVHRSEVDADRRLCRNTNFDMIHTCRLSMPT